MSDYLLDITENAKNDLRKIFFYGVGEWGIGQAEIYQRCLQATFERARYFPSLGTRSKKNDNSRFLVFSIHIVYYEFTNGTVRILRIYSSRQEKPLI